MSKPISDESKYQIPKYATFGISGLASCGAIIICHPIDLVKNRMQLSGKGGEERAHRSSMHALVNIYRNEGSRALYDGFTANIARQLMYTTTRLALFQIINAKFAEKKFVGLQAQITSSLICGFVASVIACPTDVALTRMTTDRRLPEVERKKYKNVINALIRIVKEEGVLTLWSGVAPTVLRALAANVTQLVSYKQTKDFLLQNNYMKDDTLCHTVSSAISAFVYAFSTAPLDVSKTRIQTMTTIKGIPEYTGILDVWGKIIKKEGIPALWKGVGPYFFKIAPNTMLLFVFTEKLTFWYKAFILGDPNAKGGL